MDIQFCDSCENLLYIYLDDEKLIYKCKNCNFSKSGSKETYCVYRNDLQNKEKINSMNIIMNEFIEMDPTLPNITNGSISCKECSNNDIIYVLNNSEDMKYTYICKKCKSQWTN